MLLGATGCRVVAREQPPPRAQEKARPAPDDRAVNPFIRSLIAESSTAELTSCITIRLEVAPVREGTALSGQLDAANRCPWPIAILTAPVETRLRLSPTDQFPAETGILRPYAVAYVFRKEVGLGKDAFRGDGGVTLSTPPAFAVLGVGEDRTTPLRGRLPENLSRGTYGLALLTIIAPMPGATSKAAEISLEESVERFQCDGVEGGAPLILAEGVVRRGPIAFFTVGP
jgi:hypothetical protein